MEAGRFAGPLQRQHRDKRRQTTMHSHSYTYSQFRINNQPKMHSLCCGRKPEWPERTHAGREATAKIQWCEAPNYHTIVLPLILRQPSQIHQRLNIIRFWHSYPELCRGVRYWQWVKVAFKSFSQFEQLALFFPHKGVIKTHDLWQGSVTTHICSENVHLTESSSSRQIGLLASLRLTLFRHHQHRTEAC